MTKQDILDNLKGTKGVKVRFYKVSPYMKKRYTVSYQTPEAWIYTGNTPSGYLITEEDYNNEEYRTSFFEMIRAEGCK